MIRFAADENFNGKIVRGLVRQVPEIDLVRVQDVGLAGVDDAAVLQWAAGEARVLLSHDVSTMTRWAIERVEAGHRMPGLVQVSWRLPVGQAVAELALLARAGIPEDFADQIYFLPL